jgi:hypothetical protein
MSRLSCASVRGALVGLCGVMIAACGGGIQGVTGGGSLPAQTSFRVQGTPNTPFSALITDTQASWKVQSVTPLRIVILNNYPPVRMFATKLANDNTLLSVAILTSGDVTLSNASTTAPFGTVVIQTAAGLDEIAAPAQPDTRFFVKASLGEYFDGLIEDESIGFNLNDYVRTLYLFENPKGKVDGLFNLTNSAQGALYVDLSINGQVVASTAGAPTVQLRAP